VACNVQPQSRQTIDNVIHIFAHEEKLDTHHHLNPPTKRVLASTRKLYQLVGSTGLVGGLRWWWVSNFSSCAKIRITLSIVCLLCG
jgi:hypothetical protein